MATILYGRKAICAELGDENGVPATRDVVLALQRAGLPLVVVGSGPGARWALSKDEIQRFFSRPRGGTRGPRGGRKGKA